MLQEIREYTQGWIAGTIISIIILSFALWGIHSYFTGNAKASVVAEVNGIEITKEQLAMAYERIRRQSQNPYGGNTTVQDETALKNQALQNLVDVEVLKQASTAQGYLITDQQIDSYLQNIPEFQVNGQFSFDRFQQLLAATLLSTSDFLEQIRISLLIDQPKLGIIFTSYALPDETAYTISLVNQERDFQYISVPFQHFLALPSTIAAASVQAYYDQHKNDFMTPEQVNVEYIELSMNGISASINPTDAMLKHFYDENINSYTQPMEWKLSDIIVPIKADATQDDIAKAQTAINSIADALQKGGDFDTLAQKQMHSMNSSDWVSLNQMPPELQKAVSELSKPGQVTAPIRTGKGFVIIKATNIAERKIQPFESVKLKVKDAYTHQQAEEKFADMREKLADISYEHPESLQTTSKTLNLAVQSSELFVRDKAGKDIAQYKKVRDVAFSNDVLNLQNNSDVIQINPETVIVLRTKSHIASSLLPLNSVYSQIENKLKAQEAEKETEKFVHDMLAKLNSGADPAQLANSLSLQWTKTGYLGRYVTQVDSAILDLAFRLPNPAAVGKSFTYGVTRIPSGYAVIALTSVKPGTLTDIKQRHVFAEQVQNSEGLLEYELYKQSLIKSAKVEMLQ